MNRYALIPHQGECRARLVRQNRIVLFTAGGGPATAALAGWCRLFGDRPTAEILQELDRVTSDNPTLGAFVLLVLDDDAVEVVVNGALPVAAHGAGGVEVLQTGDGYMQRRVGGDISVLGLTVAGAAIDPLLELERGIVAADGFELRITNPANGRSAVWATPATAAPALPVVTTGAIPRPVEAGGTPLPPPSPPSPTPIVSLHDDGDLPPVQPLPVAGVPTPTEARAGDDHAHSGRVVQGLHCSRNHFNDPRARYCGVCGIAMHQASFILTEDVRPPLGVLVFGDGSIQALAGDLVLGRDPSDDARVHSGDATAVPLSDSTNTLSRVHAEVRLVDWDVQLVDRGSTNGTFVWGPGQAEWERLNPDAARVLQPGTHVSFGRLTATFESSLRQV